MLSRALLAQIVGCGLLVGWGAVMLLVELRAAL